MLYEIHNHDGSVMRMTLCDDTTAEAEITKWPDEMRSAVARIVPMAQHSIPPAAQPLPAITAAASLPADVKEIIIGLAETVSAMQQRSTIDAAGHAARIADLEAEIAGLKGVVR